jgi:UMF1 family MFS transporter
MDSISAMGFFFGYISGCLMCIITLIAVMMSPDLVGIKVGIFLTGLWWFVFTLPMVPLLHKRPGPPLPAASPLFYFTFSGKRLFASMACLKHIPETRRFMLAYFLYSDAYSTIASVCVIFAVDEMGMDNTEVSRAPPKT